MVTFTRRKRRVRIHQLPGAPTFEGLQVGRRAIAGHYVLLIARTLEETDDQQVKETKLDAERVEIPKDRVVAIEVLGS